METPVTLPFETFWRWLLAHPNCILRAGTPETALYDDEHLHWNFATYESGTLVVQMLHGKRLVGDLVVDPEMVAYVQSMEGDEEGEHMFELISETETDRTAVYFFAMAHGYDDETGEPSGPVH